MESYLRTKNPKRPGVDALLSISNAMNVSIDWLVGRVGDDNAPRLYQRDDALGCFNVVLALLHWMRKQYRERPDTFMDADRIAGLEDAEIAARSMVEFIDAMHAFSGNSETWGPARGNLQSRLEKALRDNETGN